MTTAEWALVAGAVLVCLPAAIRIDWPRVGVRNATAVALFASWLGGFVSWYGFGLALSPFQMWYIDCLVIAVVLCKARPTYWDKGVIVLFAPAWFGYFGGVDDYHLWWLLWFVAMGQFLFAGLDSLFSTLRAAKARPIETGQPPGLEFAVARAGGDG